MENTNKFEAYKKAEQLTLRLVKEFKAEGSRIEDIEIAAVTAIFELHKGKTLPQTVSKIITGHADNLASFYTSKVVQSQN